MQVVLCMQRVERERLQSQSQRSDGKTSKELVEEEKVDGWTEKKKKMKWWLEILSLDVKEAEGGLKSVSGDFRSLTQ